MRKLEYLSPTSLALFYQDQKEFYLRYLAENRPGRIPQTQPMSVGSAFDAKIKCYLHERLFGANHDPKFKFETLFEAQVEPHNRDFAIKAGEHCFNEYCASGAAADLMLELQHATNVPKFEFEVRGLIYPKEREIGGVPFLGKPDVYFINGSNAHVILDWKVSGYCSKYNTSPAKGYIRLRSKGRVSHGAHKECMPMMVKGMMINAATDLECVNEDWARQLTIYSWLCGEPIGTDCFTALDQLVCNSNGFGPPAIRVAEHRLRVGPKFQQETYEKARRAWEIINSDHYFREMTPEESQHRCKTLDNFAAGLDGVTEADEWFRNQIMETRLAPKW